MQTSRKLSISSEVTLGKSQTKRHHLKLRVSKIARLLHVIAGMAGVIFFSSYPLYIAVSGSAILLSLFILSYAFLVSANNNVELYWSSNGAVTVDRDGRQSEVVSWRGVLPYFAILELDRTYFRFFRHQLYIFSDSGGEADLRQLRIKLLDLERG